MAGDKTAAGAGKGAAEVKGGNKAGNAGKGNAGKGGGKKKEQPRGGGAK